ncbi:MAG: hypothetical protein ACI837_003258 [Crocinitomicaceae bacterium]|jgi:hypothetical protein
MNVGDHVYYGLGTNRTNFNDYWEFNSAAAELETIGESSFTVYPTLAIDHVNFKSDVFSNFEVVVYTTDGKSIRSVDVTNGNAHLERENLGAGTYFYQVLVDGAVMQSGRFVFN